MNGRRRTEHQISLTPDQQRRAREVFDIEARSHNLDRVGRLAAARAAREIWKDIAAEHGFDREKAVGWRWAEEWTPIVIIDVVE